MLQLTTMTAHMNSIDDELVMASCRNGSHNRHRSLMAMQMMAMTLISPCVHLCYHHCHIDSSHCAPLDGYNIHQNNYHLANDSWHNYLDPRRGSMVVPKILVVAFLDDVVVRNVDVHDVYCDALE